MGAKYDELKEDMPDSLPLIINVFSEKEMKEKMDSWEYVGAVNIDLLEAFIEVIAENSHQKTESICIFKGLNPQRQTTGLAPLVAYLPNGKVAMFAPRDATIEQIKEELEDREE